MGRGDKEKTAVENLRVSCKSNHSKFTFTVAEFGYSIHLDYFLCIFPHIFKSCVFVPECLSLNAVLTVLIKVIALNLMRKSIQQLKYHLGFLFYCFCLLFTLSGRFQKCHKQGFSILPVRALFVCNWWEKSIECWCTSLKMQSEWKKETCNSRAKFSFFFSFHWLKKIV